MSVRAAFGLNDQLSYVRQIDNATIPFVISDIIGISVTPAEQANLEHREIVGAVIPQIDSAEKHSASYAGAWIDQAAGGVVHIAFTTLPSPLAVTTLQNMFPSNSIVQIDAASVPLTRLLSLENSLAASTAVLRKHGVLVESTALDELANTVDVDVSSPLSQAYAVLNSQFGSSGLTVRETTPSLSVQEGVAQPQAAGNRDIRTGPLYGGEYIDNGFAACTAGYANSQGNVVKSNLFMITAGHCAPPVNWRQGLNFDQGVDIGRGGDNGFYSGNSTTNCDCQTIGVLPSGKPTTSVLVNNNAPYRFTQLPVAYYSGEPTCISGASEYTNTGSIMCGTIMILEASAFVDPPGITVEQLIETTVTATGFGDSGAPWGNGGQLLGIHFGKLDGYSSFSRSTNISAATNTTPTF
ncbi:MAG TPA: hypothetical protein VG756_22940 [Pseudonocardiaceae bacterium]|jgi:hypothetical protein|nr:hypothetical protein [Pseudonocardiaceae bacterium]